MMAAKPAKEPFQNVAPTPERATARSTRAASSPPAPLSMQMAAPRSPSRWSRLSSNGSGRRLAGFSPTPKLTAIAAGWSGGAGSATKGFAPVMPRASDRKQPLFERIGQALGRILAHPQAHGNRRGVVRRRGQRHEGLRAGDAQGF